MIEKTKKLKRLLIRKQDKECTKIINTKLFIDCRKNLIENHKSPIRTSKVKAGGGRGAGRVENVKKLIKLKKRFLKFFHENKLTISVTVQSRVY